MVSFSNFPMRAQSSFKVAETMEDLIASKEDAIHWVDPPEEAKSAFLQDVGGGAYIYKLHNAVFYPAQSFPVNSNKNESRSQKPADSTRFDPSGSLLLTESGAFFSDSFCRNKLIPEFLDADDTLLTSGAELPEVLQTVPGASFFCEMFTGHFGHALVDMTARLWPFSTSAGFHLIAMRIVGFGDVISHDVGKGYKDKPDFLKKIILACGLGFPQFLNISEPSRFAELYVPSWITPFYLVRPEQPDHPVMAGLCAGSVAQSADRIAAVIMAKKALR